MLTAFPRQHWLSECDSVALWYAHCLHCIPIRNWKWQYCQDGWAFSEPAGKYLLGKLENVYLENWKISAWKTGKYLLGKLENIYLETGKYLLGNWKISTSKAEKYLLGKLKNIYLENWKISTWKTGKYLLGKLKNIYLESWKISTWKTGKCLLGKLENIYLETGKYLLGKLKNIYLENWKISTWKTGKYLLGKLENICLENQNRRGRELWRWAVDRLIRDRVSWYARSSSTTGTMWPCIRTPLGTSACFWLSFAGRGLAKAHCPRSLVQRRFIHRTRRLGLNWPLVRYWTTPKFALLFNWAVYY